VNGSTPIESGSLARYVAGESDAAQRAEVEAWAARSPENARELQRFQALWDLTSSTGTSPEVDVDAAWSRVLRRIGNDAKEAKVVHLRDRSVVRWTRWLAAAAVIAGLVFLGDHLFAPGMDRYLATNEPVEVMLADRSRVVISPQSNITYRAGDERQVRLAGEAYFEVSRDEAHPFSVESGDLRVTVLGTAFVVSAYDTTDVVTVRVRHGKVRVQAGNDSVELVAGQHAVYHKQRHFLERKAAPPAEVWGLRVLQFEGASLADVIEQLERIYKVRVQLRNADLARCKLTAEFEDEPVDAILKVIAGTFDLQVGQAPDGTWFLDGEGC